MISKRSRRPGVPQESLRQFALNNSKGIDSTKAPTDFNTVNAAKNLIVNPDGSMSLRKPIAYVEGTVRAGVERYPLYDGTHFLEISSWGIAISDASGHPQDVKVTYTRYDGSPMSKIYASDTRIDDLIFPNGNVEIINTSTSTVIGNCDVDLTALDADAIDLGLYDEGTTRFPRYIQVYYADDDAVWTMAIKQPEVNTLTTAEGEIPLNPNMVLDNPFATRDVYNAVVPAVKGIVAYVSSTVEDGSVVPTQATNLATVSTAALAHHILFTYATEERELFNSESEDETSSAYGDLGIHLTSQMYANKYTCKYKATVKIPNPVKGATYVFKILIEHLSSRAITPEKLDVLRKDFVFARSVKASEDGELQEVFETEYFEIPNTKLGNPQNDITARFTASYVLYNVDVPASRVSDITESSKTTRYRPVSAFARMANTNAILKAFCNLPKLETGATPMYYANWFKSVDGIQWTSLNTFYRNDGISVKVLDPNWAPDPDVENDRPTSSDYATETYYPVYANSELDEAFNIAAPENISDIVYQNFRIDTVHLTTPAELLSNAQYRFKIISVEALEDGAPELDTEEGSTDKYRVRAVVAQQEYTPIFKNEFEFLDTKLGNAVYGKKLYHKKSIYSYGSEKFLNNIFVSDIDSFITPLYNIIDLDTYEASQATCIVPWRDYLVSATKNAIYLHSKQADGFLTKTVNTSIGIPEEDSRCCKPILNGILFKSGPKIYQMYPNVYSGDDSTLNLTEISKAVEGYLESYESGEYIPFAFSTESEYILMLPNAANTTCLRYNYSSKLWTVCEYPVIVLDYRINSLDDIRIRCGEPYEGYVSTAEYVFDVSNPSTYADIVPRFSFDEFNFVEFPIAISFEWDTGQKTDNISLAKQFVESKLVFATEDDLEFFPMELTVHVDGDPHVTTLDVNSDAPFWKTEDSKGVANTAFRLGSESDTGVFRQLIVRYSGKGRSVRHILRGSPTSNFRLYETYVRYKTLNIKR